MRGAIILILMSFLLGCHNSITISKELKDNQEKAISRCTNAGGLAVPNWSGDIMIDCKLIPEINNAKGN